MDLSMEAGAVQSIDTVTLASQAFFFPALEGAFK